MGWKLVLSLFVGLCAASYSNTNPAWKQGFEYVYKVYGQSLSNYDDDYYKGMVMEADLIVKPQSDEVLIGKISNPKYARFEGEDAPVCANVGAQPKGLEFKPLDLGDKPFRIRVKQGVIKSIEVHSGLHYWQANIVKSIVSQTQFDIQGVNLIKDRINHLPENGSYSGVYKTMEDWVIGKFATLYELSEVPRTTIQYLPWKVPYPQLQGSDGSIMEVVKTIDYSKSKERVMYSYGLATDEDTELHDIWMGNFLSRTTSTQAFISGRPDRYTIQSAISFDVITAALLHNNKEKFAVESCYNITLSKYESTTSQLELPSSLKPLGSLTYSYNDETKQDGNSCDESNSSSSSSSSQDSNCATPQQRGEKRHKSQSSSSSSSSSSDSSFSSDFSSMSDESDWKEDQPKLSEALQSGLLPFTMGYMGQFVHAHKKVNPIEVVQKLANEIAQGIMYPHSKSEQQTLTRFVILTSFIRTMDVTQLQKVTNVLYSEEQRSLKYYAWQALRDALAEGGTGPCFLVLSGLFTEHKIPSQMAAFIFDQITHSTRQPTDEYMRALFIFTKHPKIMEQPELRTVIPIAYASLVRKVYVNKFASHDQYPVHSYGRFYTERGMKFVTEEYIPFLQEQLDQAILESNYRYAQVYISALGAIGHRYILKAFKPYFNGEKYATPFQRLQMVLALNDLAKYDPKHAQPVLYRIYQNPAEQEDVRVATVFILMKTVPPAYMLKRMAAYINIDQSEEVNSAVESIIRALAEIEGPEFEKMRENAQDALHLLNGKSYGTQYSRKFIENYYLPESNTGFMQALQTIVGEDSSMPNIMKYILRPNINGVKNDDIKIEFMVNSFDQLSNALFRQTATYKHQRRQQDQHAAKANQNQWSPENIARKLKIHREKPDYLDGSVSFEFAGLKKRFSFDVESIDLLTKVIAQVEQQLQGKNIWQFTKFINNDDMAVSTPTIMGMPFIYTFDEPTLIHFEGHVTATAEPKVSTGDSLNVPKKMKAFGEVKAYISKKRQGQLGFVVPFTGEHFLVGYEKNMQLQVPFGIQVDGDINKNQYTIQMSVLEPQQDFKLFSFNTLPYVAARSILNFTPVIEDPDTQIMKEDRPKTYVNQIIGEETGVALRIQLYSEEKLNWAWFYEQTQQYEGISLLMAPWYDESVGYNELSIQYEGKRSVNSRVQVQIGYQESDGQENCHDNGDVDIGQLYKTPTDRQARQKQLYQKACSGIANAEVQVLDAEVKFSGKQEITFSATAAVASSTVDPKSNILFYATRQPSNSRAVEPYKVALLVKTHMPKVNGLDPIYALKNNLKASIQAQLGFGKDEHSNAKFNMHATLSNTNEYKKYLAQHPLTHQCTQEMKHGNYLLSGCTFLISRANLMDHVAVKLQHENLGIHVLNSTRWLSSNLRHHFFEYYDENSVNSTGNNANQINIEANFHDDFEKVNVEIQTEKRDFLFEDVEIDELFQPIFSIHPMFSAKDRMLGALFESDLPFPYCAIDKTYANTFDNFTYPINLGNEWTVALLYSPNYANYPYQQQQGEQQQPPRYRDDYQEHGPSIYQGQRYPQHGYQQQGGYQQQHGYQHQEYPQQGYQGHQWQVSQQRTFKQHGDGQGHSHYRQLQNAHGPQSHYKQEQVEHRQYEQVEQYAVLVRDKQHSMDQKEVKIVIRSPETEHQLMEIDMVPSGRSDVRAEVYVNQKKQHIQNDRSLDYGGYIQIHSLPNGEVVFTVLDVFYILYDSHRFRLSILDTDKFQNDVRGLCGTFTGNSWTDLTCPQNCLFKDSYDFVEAYQLNRENRTYSEERECNFREVIYADVVSAQDVGEKSHKKDLEEPKGSCTKLQTRYVIEPNGQVCFTTRALPVCKQPCKPKQRITKNVDVYCVPHDQESKLWIKEINKGSSPSFGIKTPTKRVPMEVDHSCAKHF